jgi:Tfp pilus assembly protein PilE
LKVLAAVGILASAIFGAWLWELVRQRDEATRDVLQQQQHALNKAEQARRAAEAEARQLREAANESRRQREAASEAERRMQERQPEAERSTAAPQPEPEGEDRPASNIVEFKIVNNTSSTVNVAFFDRDNHVHLDPPEERFYIQGGNSTQNYQISCGPSQVICYGAHMQGSGLRPFWGTGQNGTEPCVGCCLTCPASSPLLKTLNDSDSRRPNPTITWKITDNTTKPLSVALYAPARRWGWPGWNQNWTMRSGENTYTVPCNEGERICYGAWVVNNVNGLYWGAGPFGQHACTNCCGICDGGTYTASLSD